MLALFVASCGSLPRLLGLNDLPRPYAAKTQVDHCSVKGNKIVDSSGKKARLTGLS
jgi:hypothetical protein